MITYPALSYKFIYTESQTHI